MWSTETRTVYSAGLSPVREYNINVTMFSVCDTQVSQQVPLKSFQSNLNITSQIQTETQTTKETIFSSHKVS